MTTLAQALAEGEGIERPFNCIADDHDDSHASASVNTVLGVWYCFSCFSHGTVEGHVPTVEEALSVLSGQARPRVYVESWLDLYDAYQPSPYWSARYGEHVATTFRCGTHPFTGNPTYPLRGPEGVRGVVQRQEGTPKYLYPPGVRISDTFFGLETLVPNGTVVLVEGASDVMAIARDGLPRGWSVLGCYGSGVHRPQIDLLADLTPRLIVAAFDNDRAGHDATARAVQSLSHLAPVITHDWGQQGCNDPGDLTAGAAMSALRDTVGNTARPDNRKQRKQAHGRA